MTEDERNKQAILSSPKIQADNHAFAAMLARHTGTAGPVLLDAENDIDKHASVQATDEASH